MTIWPVYVEAWQLHCCGLPFAIGDPVAWHLRLSDDMPGFEAATVELAGAEVVRVHVSSRAREEVELRAGRLHAWWEGAARARRGVLTEEHHDREAARVPTCGIVRRIRAVSVECAWSEVHRAYAPRFESVRMRDLVASSGLPAEASVTGLLVDLELRDGGEPTP